MAGVWLVVLASSSTLYGKVPRLADSKEKKQADAAGSLIFSKAFSVLRVVV